MKNAFKLVLKKATAVLLVTLLVVTQSLENIYASEKIFMTFLISQ